MSFNPSPRKAWFARWPKIRLDAAVKSPRIRLYQRRRGLSRIRIRVRQSIYHIMHDNMRLLCWTCFFSCVLLVLCKIYGSSVIHISKDSDANQKIHFDFDSSSLWTNGSQFNADFAGLDSSASKYTSQELIQLFKNAPVIPEESLSVILPVSRGTIDQLPTLLEPFLAENCRTVKDIVIVSPEDILSRVRDVLHRLVSERRNASSHHHHPAISLYRTSQAYEFSTYLDDKLFKIIHSPWVLIMDEHGLYHDDRIRNLLINPIALPIPFGPLGVEAADCAFDRDSSLQRTDQSRGVSISLASYLTPPFVTPMELLSLADAALQATIDLQNPLLNVSSFAALGEAASQKLIGTRSSGFGGIKIHNVNNGFPSEILTHPINMSVWGESAQYQRDGLDDNGHERINFLLIFASFEEVKLFSSAACLLQDQRNSLDIILLTGFDLASVTLNDDPACQLQVTIRSGLLTPDDERAPLRNYMKSAKRLPDVVLATQRGVISDELFSQDVTVVYIPTQDLPFCDWIASLSLDAWHNWHVPALDISVITHDRPDSLMRLLDSLAQGRFFGDAINLRIHMEQSADDYTKSLIESLSWVHGALTVTRRVVAGGLLPAIVESWYPHTNDTYGLILEDDIEVSPLFYAWIKMTILKYRYGKESDKSSRLFGISLYQQKHNELQNTGRAPFNAKALLSSQGFQTDQIATPYLSPVPCSWGAVYFPEHWREFHDYLAVRLAEAKFPIGEAVVPEIRSNMWTKSWKKYFIELAYLRGYIMLYPNFPDFQSLSTNHLELGSHVSEQSRSPKNKELFLLPLISLPPAKPFQSTGLLELPDRSLPDLGDLPVFNLTGSLATSNELLEIATLRRAQLGCQDSSAVYDIKSLFCLD